MTELYIQDQQQYKPQNEKYEEIERFYSHFERKNFDNVFVLDVHKNNSSLWCYSQKNITGMEDIISKKADSYIAKNYVGYIYDASSDICMLIGSKFDSGGRNYFVRYMLDQILDVKKWIFNSAVDSDFCYEEYMSIDIKNNLDILMVSNFMEQFRRALAKGRYRKYTNVEYNDSRMKGSLDINRFIKQDIPFNGKIAYRTRELTSDNIYNALFLQAFDVVKKNYPDYTIDFLARNSDFARAVEMLKSDNTGYASIKTGKLLVDASRKIVNSHLIIYEELRDISIAIIKQFGYDSDESRRTRVSGILVNIDDMWERYLDIAVFSKSKLCEDMSDKNYAQTSIGILTDVKNHMNAKREIRPDFYWKNKGVIIDAKNKPHWTRALSGTWKKVSGYLGGNERMSIGEAEDKDYIREDINQVMAYMLTLKCKFGGFAFPVAPEFDCDYEENLIREISPGSDNYIVLVPFKVPQGDGDYRDFSEQCKAHEKQLISYVGVVFNQ